VNKRCNSRTAAGRRCKNPTQGRAHKCAVHRARRRNPSAGEYYAGSALRRRNGTGRKPKISAFQEIKATSEYYPAIFGDYDKDGILDIDDPRPYTYSRHPQTIEEVKLSDEIRHMIETRQQFEDVKNEVIEDLSQLGGMKAWGRTKTPFSVVNKLRRKRLRGPKGLTDIAATSVMARDAKDVTRLKNAILKGKIGEVIEHEDFYKHPNQGYRAHHFIIMRDGLPVEVKVISKRQDEIAHLTHTAYKTGKLNAKVMDELATLAHQADLGKRDAIRHYNQIMRDKKKIEKQLTKSNPRRNPRRMLSQLDPQFYVFSKSLNKPISRWDTKRLAQEDMSMHFYDGIPKSELRILTKKGVQRKLGSTRLATNAQITSWHSAFPKTSGANLGYFNPKRRNPRRRTNGYDWQLNASTGSYHTSITDPGNKKIHLKRLPDVSPPYFYVASRGWDEGAVESSPKKAIESLRKAEQKNVGRRRSKWGYYLDDNPRQNPKRRRNRTRTRQAFIGTATMAQQGQPITNRRMTREYQIGWKTVPLRMASTSRRAAEGLYVYPRQKIYPIGDLYHARKALNYVIGFPSTRPEASAVVRAVVKAYPQYDWKAYWASKLKKRKKGQTKLESFDSYLYGRKNPKRRRNTRYTKGERVFVHSPKSGKPFYGNIESIKKITKGMDSMWTRLYPVGSTLYLIAKSPSSGASWYIAQDIRPVRGGKTSKPKSAYYVSFTEDYQRFFVPVDSYKKAEKLIGLYESHPSKKRISVSGTKPRNATELSASWLRNPSGPHAPLGQHAPFGPAGLVTKQGGLPAYGPWHKRHNPRKPTWQRTGKGRKSRWMKLIGVHPNELIGVIAKTGFGDQRKGAHIYKWYAGNLGQPDMLSSMKGSSRTLSEAKKIVDKQLAAIRSTGFALWPTAEGRYEHIENPPKKHNPRRRNYSMDVSRKGVKRMSNEEMVKKFHDLQFGDKVYVAMSSTWGYGREDGGYHEYTVGRRGHSKKYGVKSLTLIPAGHSQRSRFHGGSGMAKYKLMVRRNSISAAHGDMGMNLWAIRKTKPKS